LLTLHFLGIYKLFQNQTGNVLEVWGSTKTQPKISCVLPQAADAWHVYLARLPNVKIQKRLKTKPTGQNLCGELSICQSSNNRAVSSKIHRFYLQNLTASCRISYRGSVSHKALHHQIFCWCWELNRSIPLKADLFLTKI
jgi:hypothetical protein